MAIKRSWSLWLAVLAAFTQIHGATWPQIETDVGDYPDSNTTPLLADLNSGLSPDTTGPNGWTAPGPQVTGGHRALSAFTF